ncbi:MAG: T9SS type A sorting domain-containing protein, partial [Bacteroidota bacterium]|nr:T9SS type A sorting domain-containing protein [Bacteroidota bacterium]
TFNGGGTSSFTFISIDSAGIEDSVSNTITMPFTGLGISGTVFNDGNGLTDNIVNGTGFNNPSNIQLYAYLVDGNGDVFAKDTVNSNGTYDFTNICNANTTYTVRITTDNVNVGAVAPTLAHLPANWLSVGENHGVNNSAGTGIETGISNSQITVSLTTSHVTNVDFGIEKRPDGADKTASSQVNPGGTVKVQTPSLSGTDAEDGIKGQGHKFVISTLPGNGTLYYNNIVVSVGDTISNYDSTLLRVDPTFTGSGSVIFTFTSIDNALKADSTPNTITMPFTGLTISGTMFNDLNGLVDNVVNGSTLDNPSATTMYAYLVNGSGNVVAKDTFNNGNGTYTFANIDGNTAYIIRISSSNVNVGAIAPSSANLPTGWVAVGDAFGTNNSSGSGNQTGTADVAVTATTALLNMSGVNFGIERTNVADAKTYAGINPNLFNTPSGNATYPYKVTLNAPAGTADGTVNSTSSTVMPGKVSGSDPEDGNYSGSTGTIGRRTIVFSTLPNATNDIIAYNDGTQQVLLVASPTTNDSSFKYWNAALSRYEIPYFNDNNLSVFIKNNGHTNFTFNYGWLDSANITGDFASYGVSAYGALPVTWLSFNAKWNGNDAKLQWSTAMEINNEHFEIERSFDNKIFENIGQENATNNANINYYTFEDLGAKDLGKEVLYYRIKQVDKDGKYTYSKVQMLSTEMDRTAEVSVAAYPNPVVESTTLKISGNNNGLVSLTISDIDGKTIRTETISTSSKFETTKVIGLTDLAKGVYLLTLKGENINQTIRLVKIGQ